VTIQEEYAFVADSIKRIRERAAKLPTEAGGEAAPRIAAGMLVYYLRQAEFEAKGIAEELAKERTETAHE
jgi:hypothetical protein